MAIVKRAGVASKPPGPSSTVPSAATARVLFGPGTAVIGAALVNVNVGPDPPLQITPVVTPNTRGEVNVIGVPAVMDGLKSPVDPAPKARGTDAWVASEEVALSRIATPPKATPPVMLTACPTTDESSAPAPIAAIVKSPTCVSFSTGHQFVPHRLFLTVLPMTSGSYVPSPLRDGHV